VCTENLIRVDEVPESPKLAQWLGCSVYSLLSWPPASSPRPKDGRRHANFGISSTVARSVTRFRPQGG